MDTLLATPVTIPVSQIVLALAFCTVLLVFSRVRLALLTAYCFVLYWAKPWNFNLYTDTMPATINGPGCLFIAFCIITALLAITGLAFARE